MTDTELKFNEIVRELVETRLIETCVRYQAKNVDQYTQEDIIQDMWLWVMGYNRDKLFNAYDNGHLNALITGVLRRQLFSKNSPHYRTYRKFSDLTEEIRYDNEEDTYD